MYTGGLQKSTTELEPLSDSIYPPQFSEWQTHVSISWLAGEILNVMTQGIDTKIELRNTTNWNINSLWDLFEKKILLIILSKFKK